MSVGTSGSHNRGVDTICSNDTGLPHGTDRDRVVIAYQSGSVDVCPRETVHLHHSKAKQ
jgi:hypothetical protein